MSGPATTAASWNDAPPAPPMAAPLRMVDCWRAERSGAGYTVIARLRVDGADPGLRGLPPGPVILPGIFVVEAICQAMALALPGTATRLLALHSIRHLAPLPAGDRLTLTLTIKPARGGALSVNVVGSRKDETITTRVRASFGTDPAPAALPGPRREWPVPFRASAPAGDYKAIRAVLPQRHPLMLVDRVLDLVPGRAIRTVKAVTGNEPCYAALPAEAKASRYAYPCSLLIGSFGQTAMLLWLTGMRTEPGIGRRLLWVGARDWRFSGSVYPGDLLVHEVRLDYRTADAVVASGDTWVGDQRVAKVAALTTTRAARTDKPPAVPDAMGPPAVVADEEGLS